jgi:methionine-rich copper-binding protein CopC
VIFVRLSVALLVGVMVVAAFVATDAWAHAFLVRSSPSARATLSRPPERVQLWFNERLEPAYSRASVWDGSGQQVDAADGAVDAGEPTRLTVGVPALKPGTYTVKFRVLSVDGHLVESQFPFTVREPR